MKCFVCKKEVNQATEVCFLKLNSNGEPISDKYRLVCDVCYKYRIIWNELHFAIGTKKLNFNELLDNGTIKAEWNENKTDINLKVNL